MAIGSPQWMYKSGEAYELEQSLKFNKSDSAYLSKTPASDGNLKTWTYSIWIKRGVIDGSNHNLISTDNDQLTIKDNKTIEFSFAGGNQVFRTNRLLRDSGAWMHILLAVDTTQGTASNRAKLYVNGTQETSFSASSYPSQNTNGQINDASYEHKIGKQGASTLEYLDGYLAEVHLVDGQALTPADFGETGDYGEWKPKAYSGTYGTNGFYLPFKQDYTVEGFSTVTYKGTGANHYIGGAGFHPDLVWIKERGTAQQHNLFDTVRGANRTIHSQSTEAEELLGGTQLTAFNTDGYTLNSDVGVNESAATYVSWNWDMGGSNASNTNGSITSTVRANTTYGQSIVSYTGNATAGATVGHGLSSQPEMIIVKKRSGGTAYGWGVWHTGLSNNNGSKQLRLDLSDAERSEDMFNNNIFPSNSSTVFATGENNHTNYPSGATYIAYCFHSVTGYSKFGSYTGNGSTTGPSVTTGFKVGFLLTKCSSSATGWAIVDNTRTPTNPVQGTLYPEKSDAEYTGDQHHIDLNDNGFQIKNNNSRFNTNGDTYIYMAFADKREYAYWLDQSGNNNDWTSNNLTESDISVDSPTNNFATWNALSYDGGTAMTEGNLNAYGSGGTSANEGGTATIGVTSGKWYWENRIKAVGSSCAVGIFPSNNNPKAIADMFQGNPSIYYKQDGNKHVNDSSSSYGSSYTTGDIIGVALNLDDNEIKFYKNNVVQNSGTAIAVTSTSEYYNPVQAGTGNSQVTANFGQDSSFAGNKTAQGKQDGNDIGDFYYTPPTGYLALCTKNLPDVAVTPSEHFNTLLWSGNGSTNAITGAGFEPSLIWSKDRNGTENHIWLDQVRGNTHRLSSNNTSAETSDSNAALSSFDSDGFTLTQYHDSNQNSSTNVGWVWKANGSGSSNTNGSINSTVSANVDAGFSIVSYTGTGSNATVGHGLSLAPELIITKNRIDAVNWVVGTNSIAWTKYLFLDTTGAQGTSANPWNNTTPTSSVFTVGSAPDTNGSSDAMIAYCFHSVDGYSKVGSYIANGEQDDGTFIYTGFRPAFVMIKKTSASASWYMTDSERYDTNRPYGSAAYLFAESSAAESTTENIDMLSNGFKARRDSGYFNYPSGATYIYIAFAETPFKYSNAR